MSKLKKHIIALAQSARNASYELSSVPTKLKNKTLQDMAQALKRNKAVILKANKRDVVAVEKKKISQALIDRLRLTDVRITSMSDSLQVVARLKDPVGQMIRSWRRPNGLTISKVRVPIGVIAIIYEARPNVTADCIGLCLKSSNVVILKGGSEALHSNIAIYKVLKEAIKKNRLPASSINLIETSDRRAVDELLRLSDQIDLVIPRGGEGLIRRVVRKSTIPVLKHYKGVCHTYVDRKVNLDMAQRICFNAKVQRPSVCNAMETLLVHKDIAAQFLPRIVRQLEESGVEIRGCLVTKRICGKHIKTASEKDWGAEYLDLLLAVKVVKSAEEAIKHIHRYGSSHSDAIVTEDKSMANLFLQKVDSACVFVNTSTRFSDGYEFGFGSEIGISTDKLHARGPMALEELTTYKYTIVGRGQIRK
ncbi:glutamate-5-semialdehyde dehydrogenase [Candidatus Omnitrophota bacterium]